MIFRILLLLCLSTIPAYAAPKTITEGSYVGCVNRDDSKTLTRFAVAGDRVAFGKFLLAAYATGRCVKLREGAKVHIEESPFLSGEICVRYDGEIKCLWTQSEAVR